MPYSITLTPKEFAARKMRLAENFLPAVLRAAANAAERAVPLVQASMDNPLPNTDYNAVDTGTMKRSWKWDKIADGARIYNTSKHAWYVEWGRGSGGVPVGKIAAWAQRRLGLSEDEAKKAAFPIARKIATDGIVFRPYLGMALPQIKVMFLKEIRQQMNLVFENP